MPRLQQEQRRQKRYRDYLSTRSWTLLSAEWPSTTSTQRTYLTRRCSHSDARAWRLSSPLSQLTGQQAQRAHSQVEQRQAREDTAAQAHLDQ